MTAARLVYRVAEVAELLGLSDDAVYDLIREGALQARQQRRFMVVTQSDLAAYVNALPITHAPTAQPMVKPVLTALPALRVGGSRQRVVRRVSPIREALP